jgi:hypothetical protein
MRDKNEWQKWVTKAGYDCEYVHFYLISGPADYKISISLKICWSLGMSMSKILNNNGFHFRWFILFIFGRGEGFRFNEAGSVETRSYCITAIF